jgi:hypothetical protein
MRAHPEVTFYAYTKEVRRFRHLVEPNPPPNFLWVYSYGGRQDTEIDPDRDRVADVFPDETAITAAGWSSQEASDLLAVLGPRLVGVPANRIPAFIARMAGRRFSEWQAQADAERAVGRPGHRHLRLIADARADGEQQPATDTNSSRRLPDPAISCAVDLF